MKKTVVMAFLAATIGLCASFAQAQTNSVYAIDSRGEVVMDPFGLCWRTGFWTPAAAAQDKNGCKCDKDLIAKEICEPKAAPVKAEPKKEAGLPVHLPAKTRKHQDRPTFAPVRCLAS